MPPGLFYFPCPPLLTLLPEGCIGRFGFWSGDIGNASRIILFSLSPSADSATGGLHRAFWFLVGGHRQCLPDYFPSPRPCGFSVGRRLCLARKVEGSCELSDTPNNPRREEFLSERLANLEIRVRGFPSFRIASGCFGCSLAMTANLQAYFSKYRHCEKIFDFRGNPYLYSIVKFYIFKCRCFTKLILTSLGR